MIDIIVLGDIEMGSGTVTDDFISDRALCNVINSWAKRKGAVDLVLNGDTFDFLKVNDGENSGRITEQISLRRLRYIRLAHGAVFSSLRNFARKSKKRVFFIFGNHDQDLVFPAVQMELKKALGKVFFADEYRAPGVHVEHGHQHDFMNRWSTPFRVHGGERVLNLPFASASVLTSYVHLKEEHPFLERIHTHGALFRWYPRMVRKLQMKALWHLSHVLRTKLFDSAHPVTHLPVGILREIYQRWQRSDWNVPDISRSVRFSGTELVRVLGHRHFLKVKPGSTTVILPDTWRDEYVLDGKSGFLRPKKKHYVHVQVKDDELSWKLVHVPIKRSVWKFSDVIKNERKYLGLAAKEEGHARA